MLTFLFWNVRKERQTRKENKPADSVPARHNRVIEAIAQLAEDQKAEVLIFAELELPSVEILKALRARTDLTYQEAEPDQCTKIKVFTQFPERHCLPVHGAGDARYTVRQINLPNRTPLLLIAAHFPDKTHTSEFSRNSYCQEVARNIQIAEHAFGHQRTVVVGDLNMNPYEAGITGGLRAVMTRLLAQKGRDRETQMDTRFYNPMWQHFGEANGTPAGTYYRVGTEDEHFWNIYDQVLVRPALLPHFQDSSVRILASTGHSPLLTREGVPRREAISDHLPVLFRLDI